MNNCNRLALAPIFLICLLNQAFGEKTFAQKYRTRYECKVESFETILKGKHINQEAQIGKKITVMESRSHFTDYLAIGDPQFPSYKTQDLSMGNRGTFSETKKVFLFTSSKGLIFVDLESFSGRYYYKDENLEDTIGLSDCKKLAIKD